MISIDEENNVCTVKIWILNSRKNQKNLNQTAELLFRLPSHTPCLRPKHGSSDGRAVELEFSEVLGSNLAIFSQHEGLAWQPHFFFKMENAVTRKWQIVWDWWKCLYFAWQYLKHVFRYRWKIRDSVYIESNWVIENAIGWWEAHFDSWRRLELAGFLPLPNGVTEIWGSYELLVDSLTCLNKCYSPETCKALLNWPQCEIM